MLEVEKQETSDFACSIYLLFFFLVKDVFVSCAKILVCVFIYSNSFFISSKTSHTAAQTLTTELSQLQAPAVDR